MSDTIYSIYRLTSTTSNKFYIGYTKRSVKERFGQHCQLANKNPTTYLHKAINKYGKSDFIVECLYQSKNKDDILSKEEYFIREYNSIKNGYNLSTGGKGGSNIMPVHVSCLCCKKSFSFHNYDQHINKKPSKYRFKWGSPEHKEWMKQNNPMNNPAHRKKISDKLKGRVFTEEWKQKLRKPKNIKKGE